MIVGFPTEDDTAFQRTLDAVDAAGSTRVHVFPYSPRGTRVDVDCVARHADGIRCDIQGTRGLSSTEQT